MIETYILGVCLFALLFSGEYEQRAAAQGLSPIFQTVAGLVAAMCWPINLALTIALGFRNDRPETPPIDKSQKSTDS